MSYWETVRTSAPYFRTPAAKSIHNPRASAFCLGDCSRGPHRRACFRVTFRNISLSHQLYISSNIVGVTSEMTQQSVGVVGSISSEWHLLNFDTNWRLQSVKASLQSHSAKFQLYRLLHVLKLYCKVARSCTRKSSSTDCSAY